MNHYNNEIPHYDVVETTYYRINKNKFKEDEQLEVYEETYEYRLYVPESFIVREYKLDI